MYPKTMKRCFLTVIREIESELQRTSSLIRLVNIQEFENARIQREGPSF